MIKIVEVINAMIINSGKISEIILSEEEYYFRYDKKYVWSIKDESYLGIRLNLYPRHKGTVQELLNDMAADFVDRPISIHYYSRDFKSQEATESYKDLLQTVINKLYGIDLIVNDILDEIF